MVEFTLGIVGLGVMGNAIAARLTRSGFPLMVFDINGEAVRYFVMKNQGDIALSPRMMAERCDAVITVLPSAAALRETAFGKDGLISGARPGLTLIDMGSAGSAEARLLGEELAARGVAFLDAPVCGTPVDARAGRLIVPVGGDAAQIERFMPIFQALGERVTPAGPAGSGRAMAALADYLRSAVALALGEALLLAGREGITPAQLLDFCKTSGTLPPAVEAAFRPEAVQRSLAAAHTLHTLIDNLDTVRALAASRGLELPFINTCREGWEAMERDLGPEADYAMILRWLETRAAAPREAG
jgi:3-hydroxyisobutyrate dehydrogenase-like beta-hydroxyacid dehydrogenase